MTSKEGQELLSFIQKHDMYKYVAHDIKHIEVKIKSKMILFKHEADKLQAAYRKCEQMAERTFTKVIG
jgi:hypothetical protein